MTNLYGNFGWFSIKCDIIIIIWKKFHLNFMLGSQKYTTYITCTCELWHNIFILLIFDEKSDLNIFFLIYAFKQKQAGLMNKSYII